MKIFLFCTLLMLIKHRLLWSLCEYPSNLIDTYLYLHIERLYFRVLDHLLDH